MDSILRGSSISVQVGVKELVCAPRVWTGEIPTQFLSGLRIAVFVNYYRG